MTEMNSELLTRLVTGRKRDGRCRYDPEAKQELVRESLKPGVSVARIAMQHGVNTNLLRSWITKSQTPSTHSAQRALPSKVLRAARAFVPVQIKAPSPLPMVTPPVSRPLAHSGREPVPMIRMHVRLPNGVALEFDQAHMDELCPVMQMLNALPCSS